jgi:uncharacterized protein YgbK (DUF1537 family)
VTGPSGRPEIVFVGDDFTGASDTLATLARAGLRARLYLDPPTPDDIASENLDAVGVATALRAMPAAEISVMVGEMAPALARLSAAYYHYKVCSTFDSSADIGSIGSAAAMLAHRLGPSVTAVLGGQPSLGRYCLFGHLFAAASDGRVHRIDRHPVMSRHPVTPMEESDLRLHLGEQGLGPFRLVSFVEQERDSEAVSRALEETDRTILFDVASDASLKGIGKALHAVATGRPLLLIGSSSVAECLVASRSDARCSGDLPVEPPALEPATGRTGAVFVFAGSRSSLTREQVAAVRSFKTVPLDPDVLVDMRAAEDAIDACRSALLAGRHCLAHLIPERSYDASGFALAQWSATFVETVCRSAHPAALAVAGGDTSSAVVRHLGFASLSHLGDLDRVPLCVGHSSDPTRDGMVLMLKGGQIGGTDLFERFAGLQSASALRAERSSAGSGSDA